MSLFQYPAQRENTGSKLTQVKYILGLWPIVIGMIVLIGWATDTFILKRIINSPIPMNPLTAIFFMMLGFVITDKFPRAKVFALMVGFILALAMSLKFCDIFLKTTFELDSYLFTQKLLNEPAYPNRIAPNAALNFLFMGFSIFGLNSSSHKWISIGQALLLTTIIISLFAVLGYTFEIKSFYGMGIFTPMAFVTAITFIVTACGLLLHKACSGILRFIFNDGSAGEMSKYLLPASVLIPLLVGWLWLFGQRKGYYDPEYGVVLSVMLNVIILFGITFISSIFLNRADLKRKLAEKELTFLASHDPLTGLNNRRMFMEQLNRRISLANRRAGPLYAVFYLDIDGLKQVNDKLGHQVGDELLVQVAQLLKTCIRTSDTLARLGGDEFIILLEEISESSEVILAQRILEAMPKSFKSEKGQIPVGISIGIAVPPPNLMNADDIVTAADEALYQAKEKGKGCYVLANQYL